MDIVCIVDTDVMKHTHTKTKKKNLNPNTIPKRPYQNTSMIQEI